MEILESILIPISKLVPNTGQIEGVPKNPRTIKGAAFEKLKNSIESDQSHLYTNELKVYELGGKFVVLSGNMRLKACKALKIKQIPCKVIPQDWTIEQICKEVIISNVSSGEWNSEDLANEWDFAPLDDWGVEIVPAFVNEDDEEQDYSDKNKEIDVNDFEDSMIIKLKYTEEEYHLIKQQLSKIAQTPEQAVWILLGNEESAFVPL